VFRASPGCAAAEQSGGGRARPEKCSAIHDLLRNTHPARRAIQKLANLALLSMGLNDNVLS
jgi:hypothetical protein